jgi:hypothetical protein
MILLDSGFRRNDENLFDQRFLNLKEKVGAGDTAPRGPLQP